MLTGGELGGVSRNVVPLDRRGAGRRRCTGGPARCWKTISASTSATSFASTLPPFSVPRRSSESSNASPRRWRGEQREVVMAMGNAALEALVAAGGVGAAGLAGYAAAEPLQAAVGGVIGAGVAAWHVPFPAGPRTPGASQATPGASTAAFAAPTRPPAGPAAPPHSPAPGAPTPAPSAPYASAPSPLGERPGRAQRAYLEALELMEVDPQRVGGTPEERAAVLHELEFQAALERQAR